MSFFFVKVVSSFELPAHFFRDYQAVFPEQKSLLKPSETLFYLMAFADESAQQLCGFVCFLYVAHEIEILDFGVMATKRRQGVARCLFKNLRDWAQQKRCVKINLEVRADNQAAVLFYKSCGFLGVGCRKKYYADGCDALLFDYCL